MVCNSLPSEGLLVKRQNPLAQKKSFSDPNEPLVVTMYDGACERLLIIYRLVIYVSLLIVYLYYYAVPFLNLLSPPLASSD